MGKKEYSRLIREVETCTRCRLCESRIHAVPGEGSLKAKIMLIGEAPGYWEDQKGRPFVGAAGKRLEELLTVAKLNRSKVYITNTVKCRPPSNRPPRPDELNICTNQYLDKQICLINPKLICAMGNYAARYVLAKFSLKAEGMGIIHGKIYTVRDIAVIPLYHPAAVLHNPPLRDVLKEDWSKVGFQVERFGLD